MENALIQTRDIDISCPLSKYYYKFKRRWCSANLMDRLSTFTDVFSQFHS